jgi:hypothetical protein
LEQLLQPLQVRQQKLVPADQASPACRSWSHAGQVAAANLQPGLLLLP